MVCYATTISLQMVECPPATDAQILALHTPKHVENLNCIYRMDVEELKRQHVYVNEHSDNAIRRAVGATLSITKAVLDGKLQNGMALVRPPGHHAGKCRLQHLLSHLTNTCNLQFSFKPSPPLLCHFLFTAGKLSSVQNMIKCHLS